jgi:hypothetical protein
MPDRTVSFLIFTACGIFAIYLVMVVVTVSYAAMQTTLAADVRATEGEIATLEATYYDSIAYQNAGSPAEAGLVRPVAVLYATEQPTTGLSFAR